MEIGSTKDLETIFEYQREKFLAIHGREPGPEDPLFFDLPDANLPDYQLQTTLKELLPASFVDAVNKTGWFLTQDNISFAPPEVVDVWNEAYQLAKQG